MKRQRGRSRKGNNNNHNHGNRSFDSNGPEVKVRGNASQVYDKYTALARDAMSSGNRVKAENLRQHGEHYLRITNAQEAAKQAAREEADARREKHNERQNEKNEKTEKQGEKQASGDDEKNKSDGSNNERRPRRQPRAPRYKDNESKSDSNETADALEVVKPEPSDIVDAKDEAPKPARRRKAPTKPKAPKPDVAVNAAE